MKKRTNQKGFTLIELMIVIAIIGILMAYAIPAYRDYTVRAVRGDCNAVVDGMKTPMSEFYYKNGSWPTAMADLNLATIVNDHITGVTTAGGNIVCAISAAGNGGNVTWTAAFTAGDIAVTWSCAESGNGDFVTSQEVCP